MPELSIENVYPALVVLLGYSPTFQRVHQWRKLAQYETVRGEICGFKLENDDPVELEFVLYYGKNTPDYVRLRFQGLFEEILYARDVSIKKYTPLSCPKCHRQQERRTVIRRIQQGEKFLYCENDGKKISLPKPTERVALSSQDRVVVVRDQALSRLRTRYETSLVRVKGFIRDRAIPSTPKRSLSFDDPELSRPIWSSLKRQGCTSIA